MYDIINSIKEIYSNDSLDKRGLIEKLFIPTTNEKKINAEVSTPCHLVDIMLNVLPSDFWNEPRTIFEPCCGKGNFVLGIFDKLYYGLELLYPNKNERCYFIMENVYITPIFHQ